MVLTLRKFFNHKFLNKRQNFFSDINIFWLTARNEKYIKENNVGQW